MAHQSEPQLFRRAEHGDSVRSSGAEVVSREIISYSSSIWLPAKPSSTSAMPTLLDQFQALDDDSP